MKRSRYTDSQIMAILKQAEAGTPIPALCREYGMSTTTEINQVWSLGFMHDQLADGGATI